MKLGTINETPETSLLSPSNPIVSTQDIITLSSLTCVLFISIDQLCYSFPLSFIIIVHENNMLCLMVRRLTERFAFILYVYINLEWSLSSFCWIVDFNNPVVHTQYGTIRGRIDERKTKFNKRPFCSFLSIPYARPPIGSNRFAVSTCLIYLRHSCPNLSDFATTETIQFSINNFPTFVQSLHSINNSRLQSPMLGPIWMP